MNKILPVFLLMGILVFGSVSPTNLVFAQSEKANVLIGFNGQPDLSLVNQHGGKVKDNFYPFINVVSAELPSVAIQGLQNNPKISYIENDSIATIHDHWTPQNPEYATVWGVDHINADEVNFSGSGVKVVVIDTGIDTTHDDIADFVSGYDYVNKDNDPFDDHGHGTHVSGTIAGLANGKGIIGVAPAVDLYSVKVLSASGSGSYSNVINGILWAAEHEMDVANLSLGGRSGSSALCDAVQTAFNAGVLIVASAGNEGNLGGNNDSVGYPAACPGAMAVAATNQNDSRASFSSTGPDVDISAPGVGIYSSIPGNDYDVWSGTSMAAPHVSGVAALVKDANSSLGPVEISSILENTAIYLGDSNQYGHGLVNTLGAINEALPEVPLSPFTDIEISSISAPSSVVQGDVASITVTVSNIGNQDVASDILVYLDDDTASTSIGSQIISGGLTAGGSTVLSFDWNTSESTTLEAHTITAAHDFTDDVSSNDSKSEIITVGEAVSSVIAQVSYSMDGGKNSNKHVNGVIDVGLVGASVSFTVYYQGEILDSATLTSGDVGTVGFSIKNAPSGLYQTVVTVVVHNSVSLDVTTWDNGETSPGFPKP